MLAKSNMIDITQQQYKVQYPGLHGDEVEIQKSKTQNGQNDQPKQMCILDQHLIKH